MMVLIAHLWSSTVQLGSAQAGCFQGTFLCAWGHLLAQCVTAETCAWLCLVFVPSALCRALFCRGVWLLEPALQCFFFPSWALVYSQPVYPRKIALVIFLVHSWLNKLVEHSGLFSETKSIVAPAAELLALLAFMIKAQLRWEPSLSVHSPDSSIHDTYACHKATLVMHLIHILAVGDKEDHVCPPHYFSGVFL